MNLVLLMYHAHLKANVEWQFTIGEVPSCRYVDVRGVDTGVDVLDEHLVVVGWLEWRLHYTHRTPKVSCLFDNR